MARGISQMIVVAAIAAALLGCSNDPGGNACTAKAGDCPNICDAGKAVAGELCDFDHPCECGLFCKESACQPYEGANAGCNCDLAATTGGGTEGDTTGGGTTGGGTTGGEVDNCAKPKPEGAECNPYCQTGCEADEQCSFSLGNIRCTDVGASAIDGTCTNSKDCVAGHACVGLNGQPEICRQFCISDDDCGDGRRCSLNVNFSGGEFTASFCGEPSIGCDLFAQDCPAELACYYDRQAQASKCLAPGTMTEGTACGTAPNACEKGLICAIECTKPCSLNDLAENAPICVDVCEVDFTRLNDENAIGMCITSEAPAECDPFLNTGCAGGQSCYSSQIGFQCFNDGGTGEGEECMFTNDCAGGTACANGVCVGVCNAQLETGAASCNDRCGLGNFSVFSPDAWGVGFCTNTEPAEPCDFWKQDCMDMTDACYPTTGGFACLSIGADGAEGASCSSLNDCGRGLVCGQNKCIKPCSLDDLAPPGVPICSDECAVDFKPLNLELSLGYCVDG